MFKKNKNITIIIAHVATWVCFFMLPYIFFPKSKDIPFNISRYIITLLIAINVFLLIFYYLNTLLLIPKLLFKRKRVLYLLCIITCFAAFFYVPKEAAHWITGNDEETIRQEIIQQHRAQREKERLQSPDSSKQNNAAHKPAPFFGRNNDLRYFPGSYAVFILVFAIGTSLSVMQEWKKIEDNKDQIEREKINTELSFLKSQINPHFFFNTLNNIYSLAITESKDTASAVLKLSSIMRYVLTDTQNNKVALQSEVDFIKNYIDLQLVRLTDKVKVDFLTEGELENKQIAPLLFIPFIENAFKYGISTKDDSSIEIKLVAKNEAVSFSVINTIVKSGNIIKDTTGIGINNVKRRLELLYPDKHTLTASENNNQFIVHLDIDLT